MSGSNEIWSHKHVDPQFDTSRQTLDAPALGLKGFKKAKLQRGRVILSAPYFWMDQCVWLFHWRYFLFAQITSWRSLVIWPTKRSFHQTYKYDEKTNKLHQVGPKESTTGFLLGAVHHWPPRRPKKSTSEFLVTQKQHPPVCLQSRTKPGNIVWSPPSIPLMTFEGGSTLRKRFDRRFDGLKSLWRFQVKRAPFSSGKGDSYWDRKSVV